MFLTLMRYIYLSIYLSARQKTRHVGVELKLRATPLPPPPFQWMAHIFSYNGLPWGLLLRDLQF